MTPVNVPANEHGLVRVFSLSMRPTEARALRDNETAQQAALGTDALDPRGIEVFQISDLADMGLAGYLRDGLDAEETGLVRDGAKLGALDGWVMLLYSSAFGGATATLTPAPELTLIGTYGRTKADQTRIDIASDAAQPYTGHPTIPPTPPARYSAGGSMVVVALIVLAGLVAWWALS
jgi:hypothetical protein